VRRPAQAGTFYAGTPSALKEQIKNCFLHELGPGKLPEVKEGPLTKVIGLVCPHAGYEYSGPVAAHAYHNLASDGKPDVIILLGPNHIGWGSALATMNEGVWSTPLGNAEIDTSTANKILAECSILDVDDSAHVREHSIEVQLPFIQYLYGSSFKFVPISFLMQDLDSSREVGQAVAKVLSGKNALMIASTDLDHYEPQKQVIHKDEMVIDAILKLDENKLYEIVETYGITACGYGPVIALITASKALGAKEARLLCHKTSGDVTGDLSSVVGYASISFLR
jgi:AmmeMemoRadiSam system protein B